MNWSSKWKLTFFFDIQYRVGLNKCIFWSWVRYIFVSFSCWVIFSFFSGQLCPLNWICNNNIKKTTTYKVQMPTASPSFVKPQRKLVMRRVHTGAIILKCHAVLFIWAIPNFSWEDITRALFSPHAKYLPSCYAIVRNTGSGEIRKCAPLLCKLTLKDALFLLPGKTSLLNGSQSKTFT